MPATEPAPPRIDSTGQGKLSLTTLFLKLPPEITSMYASSRDEVCFILWGRKEKNESTAKWSA
jgi:hypothetical protein